MFKKLILLSLITTSPCLAYDAADISKDMRLLSVDHWVETTARQTAGRQCGSNILAWGGAGALGAAASSTLALGETGLLGLGLAAGPVTLAALGGGIVLVPGIHNYFDPLRPGGNTGSLWDSFRWGTATKKMVSEFKKTRLYEKMWHENSADYSAGLLGDNAASVLVKRAISGREPMSKLEKIYFSPFRPATNRFLAELKKIRSAETPEYLLQLQAKVRTGADVKGCSKDPNTFYGQALSAVSERLKKMDQLSLPTDSPLKAGIVANEAN